MTAKNRKRRSEDLFASEESSPRSRPSRSGTRLGRRWRVWPYVLILMLAVLALLPNILVWTGLHQRLLRTLTRDLDGKLEVAQVSLGWLQPISIFELEARDRGGQELLQIQRAVTSKTLLGLVREYFGGNDLGTIEIQRPRFRLQLRPDGSNLEDLIASYLKVDPSSQADRDADSLALPKLKLRIVDGQGVIGSSTEGRLWQIDDWQGLLETSGSVSPLMVESKARVTPLAVGTSGTWVPEGSGILSLQSQLDPGESTLRLQSADVNLATDSFPLSLLAPLTQRWLGPISTTGRLTSHLKSRIDLTALEVALNVQGLELSELSLRAPHWIGSDQFQVRQMFAEGAMRLTPTMISSQGFRLESDLGKLRSDGSFDLKQISQLTQGVALLNEPLELSGEIDLAAVFRMLPATLKLHQDLSLQSGTVRFQANTRNDGPSRRLVFVVDTANLQALRANQPIVWQKPLHLSGTIIQQQRRLAINQFRCETDFLQLAGNADFRTASFSLRGDLEQMMDQVGSFVDLSGVELKGKLVGDFGWSTAEVAAADEKLPIQLAGRFTLVEPTFRFPNAEPWQPTEVRLQVSGGGATRTDRLTSATVLELDQAACQMDLGSEKFSANLVRPVANVLTDSLLLKISMEGELDRWLTHLGNFLDPGSFRAAGKVQLTGLAESGGSSDPLFRLSGTDVIVEQFVFDGWGLKIQDSQVRGQVDLVYDWNQQTLVARQATLVSAAVAASCPELRVRLRDGLVAEGTIGFRGDLNRLADWLQLSPNPDSIYWFGGTEGRIELTASKTGTTGQTIINLNDLVAVQQQAARDPLTGQQGQPRWVELFRDQQSRIESQWVLAEDFDSIQLLAFQLKSAAVQVQARGSIADFGGLLLTDLEGTWSPNWNQLQQLLAAYSANSVYLAGSGNKPFWIRGPLWSKPGGLPAPWFPNELQAATAFRWEEGALLEVPIGASEIKIELNEGIAQLGTRGIPFSGGVIQASPRIDFRNEAPMLTMAPVRVIDQVALTETTARQWLKYVTPLVADSTSAQGTVTLDMENLQMPLFHPLGLEARGVVQMENVVLGAGPMTEQLVTVVEQLRAVLKPDRNPRDYRTWLRLNRQQIPFTVRDQQVYHENVSITVNDVTLITRGSVGFDQSLNMVAEIPIQDEWIEGKPLLAGLKGQTLKIPIRGTVSQPQLDRRILQNLSADLAKAATTGAVNQLISDRLNPLADELQGQVNDRVSAELNRLQNRLGGLSGAPAAGTGPVPNQPPAGEGATPPGSSPPRSVQDLGKQLEDDLKNGIRDLFRKRN
jgi:translocation and assembly module TamB